MYITDTAIIQTLASSRFKSGILRRVSLSPQREGITLENVCYMCCNLHMHEHTTAFHKSIRTATIKPRTRGLLGKSQFVHCTFSSSED